MCNTLCSWWRRWVLSRAVKEEDADIHKYDGKCGAFSIAASRWCEKSSVELFDNKKHWSSEAKGGVLLSCSRLGGWVVEEPEKQVLLGNKGLVLKSPGRHHAIAAYLRTVYHFRDKPLFLQWAVSASLHLLCPTNIHTGSLTECMTVDSSQVWGSLPKGDRLRGSLHKVAHSFGWSPFGMIIWWKV